ncbi:MAG TPA: AAA family ATPase, partial [Deinococcales bacterium]|nr:AAA family ATPase [Deinococcales bacterium]
MNRGDERPGGHHLNSGWINLPAQPTRLVGREELLELVRGLLVRVDCRLVTLTGPGGVGKTRAALATAERLLPEFPDGVVFVDLSAVREAALVAQAIAAALGLGPGAGGALERLVAALRQARLLLVLDNFEQVLDAAGDVAALLASCPHLSVIATSRERLGLRWEQVREVPPLAVAGEGAPPDVLLASPAVALFLERVRALRPDLDANG